MSVLDDFARMLGPGKTLLLLDGDRSHDSKMVRKWFEGHPRIERAFLPTGSPHMNYVENVWGSLNTHMSQTVYYGVGEYRKKAMGFLRRYNISMIIFDKLFTARPPEAEKRIRDAREQLAAIARWSKAGL